MDHSESADIWFAESLPSHAHNLHSGFDTASVTQRRATAAQKRGPKWHSPTDGWVIHQHGSISVCSGDLGSLDLGSPRATAGSNARWI